ncbi:Protein of unknown function (DUF1183) domain containing protein [Amanita muscaria]
MSSDRIELAKIPSLTLYKNSDAVGRRTRLPQLICKGTPCKLYQPEVVHCTRLPGGHGTEVDWKCVADLPDSLRFGKTDVSCEGWSGPGDSYVVKGSCSLEYRLVEVPGALRNKSTGSSWSCTVHAEKLLSNLFTAIWAIVLFYIAYTFIYKWLTARNQRRTAASRPSSGPRPGSGGGGDGGGGPGFWRRPPGGFDDPPPPYTDNRKPDSSGEGWQPGFWTGAALGGLATHVFNRTTQPTAPQQPAPYDGERERTINVPFLSRPLRRAAPARPVHDNDDRGEGSSNLGSMRQSTAYGGSNVR